MPNLILRGQEAGESINVIPLITLTGEDVRTSFLNIVMLVPFGFGLPFITKFRMKNVIVVGLAFSIVIELLQLLTGSIAGITFRIFDINDVFFNTLGVILGYTLFMWSKQIFHRIFPRLALEY